MLREEERKLFPARAGMNAALRGGSCLAGVTDRHRVATRCRFSFVIAQGDPVCPWLLGAGSIPSPFLPSFPQCPLLLGGYRLGRRFAASCRAGFAGVAGLSAELVSAVMPSV